MTSHTHTHTPLVERILPCDDMRALWPEQEADSLVEGLRRLLRRS